MAESKVASAREAMEGISINWRVFSQLFDIIYSTLLFENWAIAITNGFW